ncbi:cytochrome ubiquinol oxidase subunit I [Plasticicumulans acidivorans]|uniref:Cytochrome bd-I ubiquinol oxidase subunit 1 apoprotein n=1 Tax=Plasticicumulans acidivorans TaxID=886464 RepID=A0A317MT97_9GAMM|nr:cytochrome ubiquinol oxidase subunit I [Plasticicumulans acidivorans]PWV60121.1 cytochrome bd-I ubiquinol oxidase subunit 1 apoprotein [Plasticicumulans acidivorans]
MISTEVVDLSRLQFAITALYHFLFVPLTLGLTFILAIMESVYVMTGKVIYKDMVRFWGKLFGINFALGVTTGITMEFEFGTNWAYYSHYVGDIFGVPLAIEGLMAFFLESTFIGLFFFGWERLSKRQHLLVTYLMAIGSNLSALWILVANGWMQNPVGAEFNYTTMRMELSSLKAVFFNPDAQAKFVHTVSAGYVTASIFVLAISAWYLLKNRDTEFARRSFRIAAAFGLASAASVIVLGDESGYAVSEAQKTKLAAIEAMWETEPAPAPFVLFALPDEETRSNRFAVEIPWVLGLIATRSVDTVLPGLNQLEAEAEQRIASGAIAVSALERLRADRSDAEARATFEAHKADLGYGLLLKKYTQDVSKATPEMIRQAGRDTRPNVAPMFWSFRIMVACGFAMFALFLVATWRSAHANWDWQHHRGMLRWALYSLPLPWIACEVGWFVAEYGRQPWTIFGVLPTHLSVSTLSLASIWMSLAGFVLFYTGLLVAEMYLMIKFARLGPGSLGTGRYYGETSGGGALPAHAPACPAIAPEGR